MTTKKKNNTHPLISFEQLYWNCDDEAIKNPNYVDYDWDLGDLDLWEDSFLAVYEKVYMAEPTFGAHYLWTKHIENKIEGVIKSWNKKLSLSPVFFVKVYSCSLNVSSGNHRFSVARAFYEKKGRDFRIPFLVNANDHLWVRKILPNAHYVKTIKSSPLNSEKQSFASNRGNMKLEKTFDLFLEKEQYTQCGAMLEQEILPYVTPILANPLINTGMPVPTDYNPKDEKCISAHGTGSFIKYGDDSLLITNNHVVNFDKDGNPVRSPLFWPKWSDGDYHEIEKKFICRKRPYDVAITDISHIYNTSNFPGKKSISQDSYQGMFHCSTNELFFAIGFPTKAPFLLLTNASELNSGEPEYDENCFLLEYENLLMAMPENISGMSGALVWNTKIVDCLEKDEEWDPSKAEVAGIIFAGSKSDKILCSKIEKINIPMLVDYWKQNEKKITHNIVV